MPMFQHSFATLFGLQSVRIWNIETGRCLRWISVSQTTSIMSVSYSQGHLACSYGETICVYKVEGPTKLIRKYLDIVNEHQKRWGVHCLQDLILCCLNVSYILDLFFHTKKLRTARAALASSWHTGIISLSLFSPSVHSSVFYTFLCQFLHHTFCVDLLQMSLEMFLF